MNEKRNISILIADHNESFSGMTSQTLKAQQWDVEVVRLGKEVMKRLEDLDHPDIIIMSSILPDRNGLELCRAIKGNRDYSKVRIIIISSFPRGSRSFVEAKSRFYADEVLAHPVDVESLPELIVKIVDPALVAKTDTPDNATRPEQKESRKAANPEAPPASPKKKKPAKKKTTKQFSKPVFFEKDIPTEGRLGQVLFPELLLSLYEKRANGILHIINDQEERRISLENGIPVSINTNFIVGQSLGPILVKQERITTRELAKAQKKARSDERRLGEVLIEMGLITHPELVETLNYQANEKLIRVFNRNEGSYKFESGTNQVLDNGALDRSILRILLSGIKNHITLSLLENRIYANKRRRVVKSGGYKAARAGLQLTRKEWSVLNIINGQRTLGEIISRSPLNFIRTFQILYIFFLFGLVHFEDMKNSFFQLDESVMNRAIAEARGESDRDLATSKKIKTVDDSPQNELMQMLYALGGTEASGILNVLSPSSRHNITLSEGKLVTIDSDPPAQHQLGNILVHEKLITTKDRDEALKKAKKIDLPFGEILMKSKKITPYDLYIALVKQTETKLLNLLASPDKQEISFTPFESKAEKSPLEVDLLKIVLAALRESVSSDRIAGELSPYLKYPIRISTGLQKRVHQNLSDLDDLAIIGAINGKLSIQQIIDTLKKPKMRVMSLIYALNSMDLIEFEQD